MKLSSNSEVREQYQMIVIPENARERLSGIENTKRRHLDTRFHGYDTSS